MAQMAVLILESHHQVALWPQVFGPRRDSTAASLAVPPPMSVVNGGLSSKSGDLLHGDVLIDDS